jgi:hypothetical protein
MTFDDETLMAFADGELDPLTAKRVERAMAVDPELAERVALHDALRQRLSEVYSLDNGRVSGAPDPLATLIGNSTSSVVALPVKSRPLRERLVTLAALAACIVVGVAIGTQRGSGPAQMVGGTLVASGKLADALDTRLASATGEPRMIVSFRNQAGEFCRVFADEALDGIACKDDRNWKLIRTQSSATQGATAYRQAGSADAALMAEAQDMMKGEPLTAVAEQKARAADWMAVGSK